MEGLPVGLIELFQAANTALFELQREMDRTMQAFPGKENWREVYAMRVQLNSIIRPMTESNFRNADDARSKALGEMARRDVADGSYDTAYTGEE